MAIMQRPFFRSPRGPSPGDHDAWTLMFDSAAKRLLVRHLWGTSRHSGYDDWDIAEFLADEGEPQKALLELLFDRVSAAG